ncbi:MAG: DUF3795 domain-containing protein [Deltaproteobacteria bacterium]|nr:DUF3795 domain-containing protein [Deltaproteobacteria bacterium]
MSIEEVGCCGAYCGTCKVLKENLCKGCKLGYADGTRDITRAKCKIKVCCLKNQYSSCADCDEYGTCDIIQIFYTKSGYKYKKYREAIECIRANGYENFIRIADRWKMQYGKYK